MVCTWCGIVTASETKAQYLYVKSVHENQLKQDQWATESLKTINVNMVKSCSRGTPTSTTALTSTPLAVSNLDQVQPPNPISSHIPFKILNLDPSGRRRLTEGEEPPFDLGVKWTGKSLMATQELMVEQQEELINDAEAILEETDSMEDQVEEIMDMTHEITNTRDVILNALNAIRLDMGLSSNPSPTPLPTRSLTRSPSRPKPTRRTKVGKGAKSKVAKLEDSVRMSEMIGDHVVDEKTTITSLDMKMDELETKMSVRMDELETKMTTKMDKLEAKMDTMKMSEFEAKIDKLEGGLEAIQNMLVELIENKGERS
ncbi:hypothetical protein THAOC_35412 [Thalassiosira oceanica]|uniref:Uncharacterized protein n=1 Tax=Thalassiosira oceanica TaxID=159749 RepID=K0R0Y4_THAOC|nr:hypothetical protein THAOC_35412 [Thalassiosira oceanica]|eukprot:EJK45948.1 hypothetical protein THAOC_35412 [Thalassiosira oceanica]